MFRKFTCSITKHPPSHPSYASYTAVSFVFSAFPASPLMSPEPFNFDVLELCLSCVCAACYVMPIRFDWTPSGPWFRIRTTLWSKSLIGWVYTNSYILVWIVLCLTVACFIYYLTVRLGYSNFFEILCAQHIILNSWLSLCLRLPYFIRMLGAYDTLRFDSWLGVCWRLLNFIRTSWAHNISKFESSPYACWLLNFPYNLWRLGCAEDSWTLFVHLGHKHLQFYSLMTMRVLDIFGAYEYYQSVFIICGTFPIFQYCAIGIHSDWIYVKSGTMCNLIY